MNTIIVNTYTVLADLIPDVASNFYAAHIETGAGEVARSLVNLVSEIDYRVGLAIFLVSSAIPVGLMSLDMYLSRRRPTGEEMIRDARDTASYQQASASSSGSAVNWKLTAQKISLKILGHNQILMKYRDFASEMNALPENQRQAVRDRVEISIFERLDIFVKEKNIAGLASCISKLRNLYDIGTLNDKIESALQAKSKAGGWDVLTRIPPHDLTLLCRLSEGYKDLECSIGVFFLQSEKKEEVLNNIKALVSLGLTGDEKDAKGRSLLSVVIDKRQFELAHYLLDLVKNTLSEQDRISLINDRLYSLSDPENSRALVLKSGDMGLIEKFAAMGAEFGSSKDLAENVIFWQLVCQYDLTYFLPQLQALSKEAKLALIHNDGNVEEGILAYTVSYDRIEIAKILLAEKPSLAQYSHLLVHAQNEEMVRCLLAVESEQLTKKDILENIRAISQLELDMFQKLTANLTDSEQQDIIDQHGPLLLESWIIKKGGLSAAKELINRGVLLKKGVILQIVERYVIKSDHELRKRNKTMLPLITALPKGQQKEIFLALIREAVSNNKLQTLKVLAEYCVNLGFDFHREDNKGRTPIFYAIQSGNLEIVKYLDEQGASLTHQDNRGKNLLTVAVEYKQLEIAQYLFGRGMFKTVADLETIATLLGFVKSPVSSIVSDPVSDPVSAPQKTVPLI